MTNARKKHDSEIAHKGRSKESLGFALQENFVRLHRAMEVLEGNIEKAHQLGEFGEVSRREKGLTQTCGWPM